MRKLLSFAVALCLCWALFPGAARAADNGTALTFAPADAVMSDDGSFIYLSDRGGKKVYSIDTETFEQKSISFDLMPEALYYKDGKLYVALCEQAHSYYWWEEDQTGAFAIIDCETFTKRAQHSISLDPYDIVVSKDDIIYIPSGSGQWTEMRSYHPSGEMIDTVSIRNMSPIVYNAVWDRLYSVTTESSPSDLTAYPIHASGKFVDDYYDSPYHGDYYMGSISHIAPDGAHILSSSGNVFTSSANRADDMKFKLSLSKRWTALAFSEDGTQFYAVLENGQIYAYRYAAFEGIATYEAQGYPQYLFAKGDTLIAVSSETKGGDICFIEEVDLSAPKTTVQIAITSNPLVYEDGRAVLGVKANAKTVFNGDMMYIADNVENALFAIDTLALTETKISFPDQPNSLYYGNGELFVGFGDRGIVLILDAETFAVKERLVLATIFRDVAEGKDGFIYVLGSNRLESYSRESGQQISRSSYTYRGNLVTHPTRNAFYWADTGVSPQDINTVVYSNGVISAQYDSPYHGDYSIGARIKLSPDGNRIFTSSGSVFTSSVNQASDMKYVKKFLSFADLMFDMTKNHIYASGVGANLYAYDYDTYERQGFIKTAFPVKEMARNGEQIMALSSGNANLFWLELLRTEDLRQVTPETITMSGSDVFFLKAGASVQLSPTVRYNDGTSASVEDIQFSSDDEAVAVVDANGVLRAKSRGSAVITISAGELTKTVEVYVDFDLTALAVEGYPIDFSTEQTAYFVKLPDGTTEIPRVTYEAEAGLVVTVTEATELPGTTTVVISDAEGRFAKTYSIYFYTDIKPPVGTGEMPYIIGGGGWASDGVIHLELSIEHNTAYRGEMPTGYTLVIQLFSKEMEPISLTAIPDVGRMQFSFDDQYIALITMVDQFGQDDYIGVPLAGPIVYML